ncbi:hypothetical protein [Streptomyces katsurahamanus]|uniref:Protein kinase domain-containing protein n=1 Tax=Streptomyces katsurahamanus TaxID=2577098 RepID=A0ABW9NRJ1_9ACTN|nr:hypothetical protein [Streptomyces katsurahamanus]MQS35933.1 hypothetical protein [Streptomyces katsurahamanus]
MRTWSDSPFATVTEVSSVTAAGDRLGEGFQSRSVERLTSHPGWVAKYYRDPLASPDVAALDRLMELPDAMSAGELETLDRSTAWPVSRLTDGDRTVGVIMAEAPSGFYVPFNLRGGRSSEPRELQLDHLINDSDYLTRLGVRPPSRQRRHEITCGFLEVGVVLERYDVVYGDWSYRNALWDHGSGAVFLLDMDSCGIGTRPWIASPNWTDPAFPEGSELTAATDRYRMALLCLRCLTGTRGEPLDSFDVLVRDWPSGDGLTHLLHRALTTTDLTQRPRAAELLDVLRHPGPARPAAHVNPGSNVTSFRPVGRARQRPAARVAHVPPPASPHPPTPGPTQAPTPASTPGPASFQRPRPATTAQKKRLGGKPLPWALVLPLLLIAAAVIGFLTLPT